MGAPKATATLPERYELVRHLADGGMASVFEARDVLLDRPVAVKVLSDALAADDAARRRFTREARAAARLSSHPHVVTVFDAGEHDDSAFLVMAFYPGGSVGSRLRRGAAVPTDTALRWLAEAAGALDFAHAHGVVHRDVKPDNLLLDAAERVAVGDFGIATAAWDSSMTQTGLVLGTMAYLSPEQRAGSPATPASDRYALALVAHELLTGARRGSPDGRPLPRGAAGVLAGALAEDPEARPRSAAALVGRLEAVLDDPWEDADEPTRVTVAAAAPRPRARAVTPRAPTAAAPAPVRVTAAPAARRRHTGAVAAGVVAVLLLGGAGAVIATGGSSDGDRASAGAATTARTSTRTTRTTATSAAPATTQPPATTEAAPAATTAAPTSTGELVALDDRGFALTNQGNAGAAVPVLRQAVDGLCEAGSDAGTACAYALFNLGHALRLSGDPAAAIPYLQRRLAASDFKPEVVRAELTSAQAHVTGSDGGSGSSDDIAGKAKGLLKKAKGPGKG